jgi:uncharacterized protein YggE
MNRRFLLLVLPAALAGILAAATLPGGAASADAEPGGITVQGTASIETTPDRAVLSLGVESQAESARAALAATGAQLRRVLAALKAAGATDLTTQSVSVSPRYGDRMAVEGYTAQSSVSATVRQLAQAGAVIDAAVAAGANQVYGPSLSRGDRSELYRRALRAAVHDARASAQTIAAAANVSLGRVTAVVEGGGAPQPLPFAADKAAAAESTPIEPGMQQISATVTVTFSVG